MMQVFEREIPDTTLLIPFALGGLLLIFFVRLLFGQVRSSYVFIILYLFFGLIGLVLYWRFHSVDDSPTAVLAKLTTHRSRRLLSILILVTSSVAVIMLETRSPGAVRPQSFYGAVAIAVGLLFLRGLITTEDRADVLWVLGMVLLLGLIIKFSWVYLNPYPYVSDTQFHWNIIQSTITNAAFAGRGPYEFYPVFHLFNAAVFLLSTGRPSPGWLLPVINSLAIVGSLITFFILGRRLADSRVGLLTSVLALTGNYYFLSPMYKTNFLGVVFLLLEFFITLQLLNNNRAGTWIAFWVLAPATLLIHPVVFIALIFVVIGAFLSYSVNQGGRSALLSNPVPMLSLSSMFVTYLIFIHTKLFSDLVTSTIGIDSSVQSSRLGLTANFGNVPPISPFTAELVVNFAGIAVPAALIVPGFLYSLQRRDIPTNSLALAGAIMYVVALGAILGGIGGGLSITRILLYISPLTALLMTVGIYLLVSHLLTQAKWPSVRTVVVVMLVFIVVLSFLSFSSYRNNFNGSSSSHVEHYQLTMKPSTLASHSYLERVPDRAVIAGDAFTVQYVASTGSSRGMQILEGNRSARIFFNPEWKESEYYLVNEPALRNAQADIGPDYVGVRNDLHKTGSRVYSNTEFGIYYRNGSASDLSSPRLPEPNGKTNYV